MSKYGNRGSGLERKDPAYFLTWKNKRRDRRYHHLRKYMEAVGCADCGYNEDHRALVWDHIEPLQDKKAMRVGHYISCCALMTLKKELRKCQVLCANCHMIKTKHEGGYSGVSNKTQKGN